MAKKIKNRYYPYCCWLLILLACSGKGIAQQKQQQEGKLFIIGGGHVSDDLRRQMLVAADWKKGDIIAAVTLASGYGDSAYLWMNEDFKKLTGEDCLRFDSAAVHNPASIAALSKARIIYIGGGDQERIMRLIKNSSVQQTILRARKQGAMIAGTSAGASAMSAHMITGNALLDTVQASTFKRISKGNLELKAGLGLLDSVIIDQHFITRSRYNRMLSAIMEYPYYDCIGINEATALLVDKGWATVIGESQVIVFSKPQNIHANANGFLAASAITLSIYLAGEKFAIKK
ncbi:MAG TPA: cyanophycinase [Chitinophagaceae bacterium]|nr:cyanophycinase [Chitinophagaceae bacterium]